MLPSRASEGTNPIDAFLLEKLDQKGLTFSPEADKRTLIRRVYFDLIGLPPAPDEVQRFLADDSPHAYERVIDHLLSLPQYGERWGRHWLDVAGYSESDIVAGQDEVRPDAFRYRNYVVRSFNADKPFDQFIREQLAGDELAMREGVWPAEIVSPRAAELLAATGFLRMALDPTTEDESLATRNQVLTDTLNVVSTSLLGLTVGCAQCHDHRFDPLLQEDYYRLQAVFQPVFDLEEWRKPSDRRVSLYSEVERARADGIEAGAKAWLKEIDRRKQAALDRVFVERLREVPEPDREAVGEARNTDVKSQTDEQKTLLSKYPRANVVGPLKKFDRDADRQIREEKKRVDELRATKPPEKYLAIASERPGRIPETFVFHRGNPEDPGRPITGNEIGDLLILSQTAGEAEIPGDDSSLPSSGRRLAFAEHLTSG